MDKARILSISLFFMILLSVLEQDIQVVIILLIFVASAFDTGLEFNLWTFHKDLWKKNIITVS